VRHLELRRHLEADDFAGQDAQPLVLAVLVADVEQQLEPQADPQKRLPRVDRVPNRLNQIAPPQLGNRILEGAHARQHDLVGSGDDRGIGRDDRFVADFFKCFLYAAQITHLVIDNGDHEILGLLNDSVNVAAARNRCFQFRRDPPLTFNRLMFKEDAARQRGSVTVGSDFAKFLSDLWAALGSVWQSFVLTAAPFMGNRAAVSRHKELAMIVKSKRAHIPASGSSTPIRPAGLGDAPQAPRARATQAARGARRSGNPAIPGRRPDPAQSKILQEGQQLVIRTESPRLDAQRYDAGQGLFL